MFGLNGGADGPEEQRGSSSPDDGRRKRVRLSDGKEGLAMATATGSSASGMGLPSSSASPAVAGKAAGPKIKLSLKMGALRRQQQREQEQKPAAQPPAMQPSYDDAYADDGGYYYDDEDDGYDGGAAYGDEHVDIDGHDERAYAQPASGQSAGVTGGSVVRHNAGGAHTPRIKLRFSMKKKPSAPADGLGGGEPQSGAQAEWAAAGGRGVAAGGSSEGVAYSPSAASEAESDGTETANAGAMQGGRRRGRPCARGRRSSSVSSWRARDPTPMSLRLPVNPATTTVSLKKSLTRLIERIRKRDDYALFQEPVDAALVPGYLDVIQRPMDLGTIRQRVEADGYGSIYEFRADVMLVCENARVFNGVESFYAQKAGDLERYAVGAIERETAKLEARGIAEVAGRSAGRSRSHSRSTSPQPQDADGVAYDSAGRRFRRSTRIRYRGDSAAADTPTSMSGGVTAAGTVDIFRWTDESKKKYKRASSGPKRMTEGLVRVKVLADGSVDPAGFEEDIALVAYDRGMLLLPGGQLGPCARAAEGRDVAGFGLQPVHGDALGLAYWRSVGEFIDGAGEHVARYASAVMGHLTQGAYHVAGRTVAEMAGGTVDAPEDDGDSAVDVPGLVRWLDTRAARDRLYAERVDAMTRRIALSEFSAGTHDGGPQARMSGVQKDEAFRRTSQQIRRMSELGGAAADAERRVVVAEEIRGGIGGLAEQMCLALTGNCQPSALIPGLPPPPRPAEAAGRQAAAARAGPVPRPPMRSASTPSLPR
ncbi:hypothetical protein GGI15_004400 [Coemansia interrupta]|uniref:Bromo domain-containing protein n=1 Tax=Coemansia interrupta TaxID=1126814 RepID=A0A9W8H4L8_9FUNG|nr:hypothetical protein GGI15_004400 [Coemansia interrupta]